MIRRIPIGTSSFARLQADVFGKKNVTTTTLGSKPRASLQPVKVVDPYSFDQLKLEEHKQFTEKKRTRFKYTKNYSAALALPYSKLELTNKRDAPQALLSMANNHVIEHANRRVDLFFYTLIAYYKTMLLPTNGHTNLQHGRGSEHITEACHSSLIPSLLDKTIYQHPEADEKHKSLLSGTHLMNSLNATVELPSFVNAFDDVLELKCRPKCLELIGAVSQGKITPIDGLNIFLQMMQDTLNELKRQAEQKKNSLLAPYSFLGKQELSLGLINLVIKGTLATTFSAQKLAATDAYIQLLLRLTPEEKMLCEQNDTSKDRLYLEKIMGMQQEILQAKSEPNVPCL